MSFIAHFFATHPQHRQQIAENPAIIHQAVEELMRRFTGSYLARTEVRLFLEEWFKRIPDFCIKPGEQVRFGPGAVNCVSYLPLAWQVGK